MSDAGSSSSRIDLVVEPNGPAAEWDERKRRNSGCTSDQGRQKKAKALASDSDTDTDAEMALLGLRSAHKRDATYYFEDGSCILLVEDTLFNVRPALTYRGTLLKIKHSY